MSVSDSDQVLEDLKNASEQREKERSSLHIVQKTPTKSRHNRGQAQHKNSGTVSQLSTASSPSTSTSQAQAHIQRTGSNKSSGKAHKGNAAALNSSSAAFLRSRYSKRRIGGPDYGPAVKNMQNKQQSKSMNTRNNSLLNHNHSLTGSTADEGATHAGTPRPVAMSLGRGGMPKPVDLGGSRRNSKNELTRERSKSSLSGGFSQVANAEGKQVPPEIIIRYGELLKKGVVDTTWKRRFFVLTDKHIYYYTQIFEVPFEFHLIDILPKGQIPLNIVEDVKKDKEDRSGTKFNLYTPARTYRLKMETDRGADAWVAAIAGACENAKQQMTSHFLNSSRRDSFSSIKADEVDAMSSSAFRDPTKQLRSEERLLVSKARKKGNGPHKPAALDEFVNWTAFDVAAWLYTVQLGKYTELFFQNSIDGKALKELTKKQDVLDLGVEEEDVMNVLSAVEKLNTLYADEGGDDLAAIFDTPVKG